MTTSISLPHFLLFNLVQWAFCSRNLWNCFGKGHWSLPIQPSGLSVVLILLDHSVTSNTVNHIHFLGTQSLAWLPRSPSLLTVLPFKFSLAGSSASAYTIYWGSYVFCFWSFVTRLIGRPCPLSWLQVHDRSISLINPSPWALKLCMCWLRHFHLTLILNISILWQITSPLSLLLFMYSLAW